MTLQRFVVLSVILMSACLLALPNANAASVTTVGPFAAGEGTIGHGAIQPPPAPFDANTGVNLGFHPASGFIASVYTLLCSRDVFNTSDGSEGFLASHGGPFCGTAPAGPDMNALGVSGTVYYSFRGLELDYNSPSDFTYDLGANIETRIYRGGEIEFYQDSVSKPVGPTLFARSTDMVLMISINWNTFGITQTVLGSTADSSPGMLALLVGMSGISASPVQQTGTSAEGVPYSGAYGVFNDDGSTWEFTSGPVSNENATWGAVKRTYH